MQIHNFLNPLIQCLQRWEKIPDLEDFTAHYFQPMIGVIDDVFDDAKEMYALLADLNWEVYRKETLLLDPVKEEARVRKHLEDVEALFGFELQGEIVLFGAFTSMDGYARFERGRHRVYLGVDESHGRGKYLDILEVHELTHVARESRPEVWLGWGLDPKMSHDDFSEHQPVVEHLFGEGFSCAVSELLVPSEDPWHYAYQEKKTLARIMAHADAVDRAIHRELAAGSDADWGRLYNSASYQPRLPIFTHYVWAWKWAQHLLRERAGGNPRKLVNVCSREFLADALRFRLG